jgi:hypothetical protein
MLRPGLIAQASSQHLARQQELVEQMELRRKMRSMVVPTDDAAVRALLRQLAEPVTLFGEREVRAHLMLYVFNYSPSTRALLMKNVLATSQTEQLHIVATAAPCSAEPLLLTLISFRCGTC